MTTIESEFPVGHQRLYQALRDAGFSNAPPLRNVEWIGIADDGVTVLNLWRDYIKLRDGRFVAEIDARDWIRDGIGSKKTRRVIAGLAAMAGRQIRCVILEKHPTKPGHTDGARLDPRLWTVQDDGKIFILHRGWRGSEDELTARMLKIYEDAKTQIDYRASRFLQKVRRDRGLKSAKYYLRPDADTTEGFARLLAYGRLDLSVEAVALDPTWSHLFTAEELATAHSRLEQAGYFNAPDAVAEFQGADEVDPDVQFEEGQKTTVQVNAYERDPKARALCLKKYGAVCVICGFDFGEAYGHLGRGYIHVHHLNPLHAAKGKAATNPIRDLRPVCANCHSIIHLGRVTRTIEMVREVIEVQRKRKRA